ncbi:cell adhesion molecule 2-like [Ruditapes philippinarum]|uniref:cell adhesion molecule 2-like n=1 Tax=Ruditapes philippinarum TaxID=129788 RepID=UPI00295B1F65|nr:cell adhesion molecule 2-like [Ruditapes philippinarum]
MIRNAPTNVTVLEGSDAKFFCNVIEQRSTDFVFWKKVSLSGFVDVLTYNGKSVNDTKYSVQGTYSLTVHNVVLEDEAWYECQAGIDRARAMLTVNVKMANMTLTWGIDPPFTEERLVNLTCHVMHSRPPADVTWYHGQTELTSLSSTCQKSSSEDGFGDTISTLTVVIDPDNVDNAPYRCEASLPNSDVKRTEVAFVAKVARSTSGCNRLTSLNVYRMFALCTIAVYIVLR